MRLFEWPASEQKALAFSFLALPLAELGLQVAGYRRTRSLFMRAPGAPAADQAIDPVRAYQIVKWVARRTIGEDRKCLRRSFVLARILQANGYAVTVHIGFRKDADGALDGHAWCDLEDRGTTPLSPEGTAYVRFE